LKSKTKNKIVDGDGDDDEVGEVDWIRECWMIREDEGWYLRRRRISKTDIEDGDRRRRWRSEIETEMEIKDGDRRWRSKLEIEDGDGDLRWRSKTET